MILLAACGEAAPPRVLDLETGAATCYTATRRVLDLQPDDRGVWAATEGGLLRFSRDGALLAAYTRADGLVSNSLRALAREPDGTLWIASDDGVSRLRGGRFDRFTEEEGLNDDRTYAVEVDTRGIVMVGTERGIARFDGQRFEPFSDTHEFGRRATYAIHAAADGSVWFAKENALTRWIDGSNWEVFQRDPLLAGPRARLISNSVRAVVTDRSNRPWVGTHAGLGYLDASGWSLEVFAERAFDGRGPLDNRIATVAFDRRGAVWIGHGDSEDFAGGRGAARFVGEAWEYFDTTAGLPDNRVLRIRAGRDGTVWLATADGIARHDSSGMASFASAGDLPANHVTALEPLGDASMAVTTTGGMVRFGPATRVTRPPSTGEGATRCVDRSSAAGPRGIELKAADGARWVGTRRDGLWRCDGAGWAEVRLGGRRLPGFISAMAFEDPRTLWVGTVTEGAIRLDLGRSATESRP